MQTNHNLTIHPIPVLNDNYVWTIINNNEKSAIIVDPGEAQPVLDFLEKNHLSLRAILITHHHWDHTHGIDEILKHHPVAVYGPANEAISHLSNKLDETSNVDIPGFPRMQILEIPCHTRGHIAYYSPGMLFSGDTLFSAGCGRLFEGSAEQMYRSLQKMAALPDDTSVYCAHEYTLNNLKFAALVEPNNPKISERIREANALLKKNNCSLPSTIYKEKETNPFLRCHVAEVIAEVEKHVSKPLENPIAVFTELRKWKDHF